MLADAAAASGAAVRVATALAPRAEDYRVLKPKHSAFFGALLDLLLQRIVETVVLVR